MKYFIPIIILLAIVLMSCNTPQAMENQSMTPTTPQEFTDSQEVEDDVPATQQAQEMQEQTPAQEKPVEVATNQEKQIIPSNKEIKELCNSLCDNDREAYCREYRSIASEFNTQIIGTCRTFAKYNSFFDKCESFCKPYGDETGCLSIDGKKDADCDGLV